MSESPMNTQEILAQYGPREAMEYDVVVVGGGADRMDHQFSR